jgi:hypothetical protein
MIVSFVIMTVSLNSMVVFVVVRVKLSIVLELMPMIVALSSKVVSVIIVIVLLSGVDVSTTV